MKSSFKQTRWSSTNQGAKEKIHELRSEYDMDGRNNQQVFRYDSSLHMQPSGRGAQTDSKATIFTLSDHMKVADIISKRVNKQKVNPKEIAVQRIARAKEEANVRLSHVNSVQAHGADLSSVMGGQIRQSPKSMQRIDQTTNNPSWRVSDKDSTKSSPQNAKSILISEMIENYSSKLRASPQLMEMHPSLPRIPQSSQGHYRTEQKQRPSNSLALQHSENNVYQSLENLNRSKIQINPKVKLDPRRLQSDYEDIKIHQQEVNNRSQQAKSVPRVLSNPMGIQVTSLLGQNKHDLLQKLDNTAEPYALEPQLKKANIPMKKKGPRTLQGMKAKESSQQHNQSMDVKKFDQGEAHRFEPAKSVQQVYQEMNQWHDLQVEKKEKNDIILMKGKSKYDLPNKTSLYKTFYKNRTDTNMNFLNKLAKQDNKMGGVIQLNEKREQKRKKQEEQKMHDPLRKYVDHFNVLSDLLEETEDVEKQEKIKGFAAGLKQQIQVNKVKTDVKGALFQKMMDNKQTRQASIDSRRQSTEEDPVAVNVNLRKTEFDIKADKNRQYAFGKTLEEETKQMYTIANKIRQKEDNHIKFKKPYLIEKEQKDPHLQFFSQCLEHQDLALPILDKIWKKTICLQNYFLSEGNIKGLASSCKVLDCKLVNRLLLQNNGIDGDQFAQMLDGFAKLRDFKSLIYKQNVVTLNSMLALKPIFQKRLPHELQELKFIDCKIQPSLIKVLMQSLTEQSQLKKLALINIQHSVTSFETILEFIEHSETLEEVDLSWSVITNDCAKDSWLKLANVLHNNKTLRNLQLAYNQIFEKIQLNETAEYKIIRQEKRDKTLQGFKNFIKYNPSLIHLDLQMCGLTTEIIKQIGYFLTRATSLQCIHLCGNDGIDDEMIAWLRQRIKAKEPVENPVIQQYNYGKILQKYYKPETPVKTPSSVMGLFGLGPKQQSEPVDPQKEWKELRAGLKLQSIVHSKRMNEHVHTSMIDKKTCIITRHINQKHLIPGSGQWQITTDSNDESWFQGQHILTLFLWSPRIGQLSQVKDPKVKKHYKDQFEAHRDGEVMVDYNVVPKIQGTFNNWQPKQMRDVIEFCRENDQNPPDYIPELIKSGHCRAVCGDPYREPLKEQEQHMVDLRLEEFYENYWSSVIMTIMEYKQPLVANAHTITNVSTKVDPNNKIYFHIDWVKPGRHTFVVEHDHTKEIGDMDDQYLQRWNTFKTSMQQGKKNTENFFVHEMLSTFRSDTIPLAYKTRHTTVQEVAKFKPRKVFADWGEDTRESLKQACDYDLRFINLLEIVNNDLRDANRLTQLLQDNYGEIKEIYHYLQSKSSQYPNIDFFTIRQEFILKLDLPRDQYSVNKYELYMHQAHDMQNRGNANSDDSDHNMPKVQQAGLSRFMFIEMCFRLAKSLYAQELQHVIQDRKVENLEEDQKRVMQQVAVHKAFDLFYLQVLKPYYLDIDINWQSFRENKLQQYDVELLFTMNMNSVDKIYSSYKKQNQDTKHKAHNQEFMVYFDCQNLIQRDLKYQMPKAVIKGAFAMSKMTVINELDPGAEVQYKKLTKPEFLEFICRIAELFFKDSELEHLQLHEKLEYLLDDMFKLVGDKRVKQEIHVEEFSDSDDDY